MRRLLPVALLPLLFIGCLDACRPDVDLASVPDDAPSEAGDGPIRYAVRVTDQQGSPQPLVPVITMWETGRNEDTVTIDTVWARTDAQGVATFGLPASTDIFLLAGAPGWNEEWLGPISPDTTVTLFPESLQGAVTETWDEPATIGANDPQAVLHPLPFAGGWNERLEALEVTLTWTNAPTGSADFGIAVGEDQFRYWNQQFQTTLGDHSETLTLTRDELEAEGLVSMQGIGVGPSVSTGQFNVAGIPYELTWTATFDTSRIIPPECAGDQEVVVRGDAGQGGGFVDEAEPIDLLLLVGGILVAMGIIVAVVLATRQGRAP